MTSSNGNIFRVTGHLCGNSPVPGEFPSQRSVTRSFDVFFDLCLNTRLSKQSWGWWFETLSRPLWHHCNAQPHHFYCLVFLYFRKAQIIIAIPISQSWWTLYDGNKVNHQKINDIWLIIACGMIKRKNMGECLQSYMELFRQFSRNGRSMNDVSM